MTDLALLQNVLRNEIMRSVPHLNAQATMFGSELATYVCWISIMAGAFLADKTNSYSVELLFCHLVYHVGLPTILQTPGDMYNMGYCI